MEETYEVPTIKFMEGFDGKSEIGVDWDGNDFGIKILDESDIEPEEHIYIMSKEQAKALVIFITDQLEKDEETK